MMHRLRLVALCLLLVHLLQPALAGNLHIDLALQHGNAPLRLNSLRYQHAETYSLTRVSYLMSGFAVQELDGQWLELPNQFAYIDAAKRRTNFVVKNVAPGNYKGLRFSIGLPVDINHGDSALHAAGHPLNPNLNQLHWNWTGGYIFLALEGVYRAADQSLKGFVYHLANDANATQVQLAARFRIKETTGITVGMDVAKLFTQPRALSFIEDGVSTHSHPGDPIASALVANLQSSFSILQVIYPEHEAPREAVEPLHLPKTYTPYRFTMSRVFPQPALPRDNPLLEERVDLGEKLFHDPLLSRTGTLACASCHQEAHAFSDSRAFSSGVENRQSKRHSMPLFNLAWKSSFFWDGRAPSLREQSLMPIQDHLEMDEDLDKVIAKLRAEPDYQRAFAAAFDCEPAITPETLGLALENFMLTLTSYDSKFDRAMAGQDKLNKEEARGMELFFTEFEPRSGRIGADCFHCHGGANFSDHQFHNNGLAPGGGPDYDMGRFGVTGKQADRLVFSTPSLRNVALTAPYMHDGRFATLEQVIDHYSGPMHASDTLDPNLAKHPKGGLQLSDADKTALVAFLKTLTDPKFTREHVSPKPRLGLTAERAEDAEVSQWIFYFSL